MTGRHGSKQQEHGDRNRKMRAHIFNHKHGAKMQRGCRARVFLSEPTHSDVPPPARLHLPILPTQHHHRGQVFEHWSLWVTLLRPPWWLWILDVHHCATYKVSSHYTMPADQTIQKKSRFHDNLALMGRWEKGWPYQGVGRRKADVRKLRTRGWQT